MAAGYFFNESDLMKCQPLDFYDDVIEDETAHEENETASNGNGLIRRRYKSTVDQTTVSANPLDSDLLAGISNVPDSDVVEVRRGAKAEGDDEAEPELPRTVAPAIVRQQNKDKLAAALAGFGKLPSLPKEGANDNYKSKESWPLIDQLTRSSFEPDRERRTRLIEVVRHVRELIDVVGADSLGLSIHLPGKDTSTDYALQRTKFGDVHFENGQTLDRKRRTYDGKNGEADAERYDGAVRKGKPDRALGVSNGGFDPYRDDPFSAQMIAAHEELDEIIASVGPLWTPLVDVISANATMTNVGETLGARNTQAPGVGTAIIRLALTAAMEAIERFNQKPGETYLKRLQELPDSAAVPARRLKRALEQAQFGLIAA
jgi:hypothetical protein